ncbi:MAG: 23S rRNA (guanosine(2251)-2'-O)-methyltransferase RlmB, partial [Gammaproteobacteria bacterium]|nr:23S rRNA (guanosine(2251)-2'-O)-methyltransferase RlmB [Gemmatimonadota bacterium]NIU77154.1 23S rRNA (guanosine(2251)-2'-O)-methyltransferase RlmB [Gammaproteobacteria bacterium]NIY10791.1 23S rRNA (guanosine(2251)-2'-O)-methyltransferase RlmB [Gemmatimonadota bacterium]
ALRGKGPTPPAEQRPGHPKSRRADGSSGKPSGRSTPKGRSGAGETVAGRNAVVEALRAGVPVHALYVAENIDADDRVREVLKIGAERGLAVLEAPRPELDRLTDGATH